MTKTTCRHVLLLLPALCSTRCKGSDADLFQTFADSTEDAGIYVPDVDLPAEGTPDVPLPTGVCMQEPQAGLFGYWHQCRGELEVNFIATSGNTEYAGSDLLRFGPGVSNPSYWVEPDNYDLPLVAACCGPFDYPNPSPEQKLPYLNNCLFDAVQQLCVGLPYFLRKQAQETNVGDGKLALEALAGKIEDNLPDCVSSLWAGGPPGPSGDNVNELSGSSWSPPGTNATISIPRSEIFDWTEAGDMPELTPCFGIFDNDAAVIPTAPILVPGIVDAAADSVLSADAAATALGPWRSAASFVIDAEGSGLTVARDQLGAPIVTRLTLESPASSATLDGNTVAIEHARLTLARALVPMVTFGEHVVAPGDALFTAVLDVVGEQRIVAMSTIGPIVFREQLGAWSFDPFELAYDEVGIGQWTLSIDGLDFRPR